MMSTSMPSRCRIVLVAPPAGVDVAARVDAALAGGDVASLLIPDYGAEEAVFQPHAEALAGLAHARDVAAIVAGEPRVAARIGADGLHVDGSKANVADAIRRYQRGMSVGCGGAKSRHQALELGELQPDYIFFGRFGYDTSPDPHPRNLALATWWAELISIPCVVLAGTDEESVLAVARTGAEFVAVGAAAFSGSAGPAASVTRINELLDRNAPVLERTVP